MFGSEVNPYVKLLTWVYVTVAGVKHAARANISKAAHVSKLES